MGLTTVVHDSRGPWLQEAARFLPFLLSCSASCSASCSPPFFCGETEAAGQGKGEEVTAQEVVL